MALEALDVLAVVRRGGKTRACLSSPALDSPLRPRPLAPHDPSPSPTRFRSLPPRLLSRRRLCASPAWPASPPASPPRPRLTRARLSAAPPGRRRLGPAMVRPPPAPAAPSWPPAWHSRRSTCSPSFAVVRRGGKTHSLSALAALLRLLFRGGEVRAAWKVFDEMAARGPRPSLATFNAMILGFCHRGLVRVGAGLLAVMGRFHIVPDACSEANTITFNVLIDRYAKAGRMDEANAACREMKARGLVPDCCTFNILAAGAYKVGKAVQLAHEHQELHEVFGSQMSADGLDMLVCRLCWDGQLDDACELLCSTIEQSVPMSVAGFNALIVAYSKEGFGEEAFELYRIMNKICLAPSSPTLNYLIMRLQSRKTP